MVSAIVLGAGRGSRMGSLTEDGPKCLVTLAGKTLLDWQISALREAGCEIVSGVVGYQGGQIANRFDRCFENARWAKSNMVQSLWCAAPLLRAETCILSYSDIAYHIQIVQDLMACDGRIVITADLDWHDLWSTRFDDPSLDAESFKATADGRLIEIGQKNPEPGSTGGQFMGLLKLTPDGWSDVETYLKTLPVESLDRIDMTSLLESMLKRGTEIRVVPTHGRWVEVDSEDDLKLYERNIVDVDAHGRPWRHDWRW